MTYLFLEDDVCGRRFFGREGANASCLALLLNPSHLLVKKLVAYGLQLRLGNHDGLKFFFNFNEHVFGAFLFQGFFWVDGRAKKIILIITEQCPIDLVLRFFVVL